MNGIFSDHLAKNSFIIEIQVLQYVPQPILTQKIRDKNTCYFKTSFLPNIVLI